MEKCLYRIHGSVTTKENDFIKVQLVQYPVFKETDKSYTIKTDICNSVKRINKNKLNIIGTGIMNNNIDFIYFEIYFDDINLKEKYFSNIKDKIIETSQNYIKRYTEEIQKLTKNIEEFKIQNNFIITKDVKDFNITEDTF